MPKDLEQIKKELKKFTYEYVDDMACETHEGVKWDELCKHVNQMLIDRAIEELALWFDKDLQPEIKKRIAELQKEKELL